MHCQISFSFTTQRTMKFEGDYSCITAKRKAREFIMQSALYFQMPSTIEKSKLRVQKTEGPSWFSGKKNQGTKN